MDEHKRQAAAIKASISTYVATASLAALAGALALFTYISQNFVPPWTFYVAMVIAVVLLVASIGIGGDGQDLLVRQVANGDWANEPSWQFNWQAILTLVALISLVGATALGATASRRASVTDARIRALEHTVSELQSKQLDGATATKAGLLKLQREISRIEKRSH